MALNIAIKRSLPSISASFFSLEKTSKLKPEISRRMISSSAKFVRNVANIFVSIKEENTAKTGSVNENSKKRYSMASTIPVRVRKIPAHFQPYGNNMFFIRLVVKSSGSCVCPNLLFLFPRNLII